MVRTRADEVGALAITGLSELEEAVLWQLADNGEVDVTELSRKLDVPLTTLDSVLEGLSAAGAIARTHDGRAAAAVPLDLTLGARVRRLQDDVDRARGALSALADLQNATALARGADLVTIVRGRRAIREQIRQMQEAARDEMAWLCRPGAVVMPSSENDEEFSALARGVAYRVVYDRRLLEEDGMLEGLEQGIVAGEMARAAELVPVRLAIADRRVALCPLVAEDPVLSEPSAVLLRPGTLLDALIALFELVWERGVPLHAGNGEPPHDSRTTLTPPPNQALTQTAGWGFTETDRQLLSWLAAGLPDKAIASNAGVSVRTVRRRVAALMKQADCQTRIELVWQAARHRWI